jgi:hypothetical protein
MYVIALGDAWDGISLYGTFGTSDEAVEYANDNLNRDDWTIIFVRPV